ncbi:MAG: hypothetical protein KH196_11550, partial [Oscillospiraceae bacterium]|nr:hypothetical protein [Oscillospiraceae bacterium]
MLKAKLFCEAGCTPVLPLIFQTGHNRRPGGGLHLPYKGLVAARASNRTEFYFTCIPPARKWA